MNMLVHLVSFLVCLETVYLYPIQDETGFGDSFGMRLAKRPFYPYKETILSPFGFFENPREGQRKKAVDSTFIRFGRSSPSESRNARDIQAVSSAADQQKMGDIELAAESVGDLDGFKVSGQRFLLNHNGCRVANSQQLMKALLNDPNCIRAFQKVKRENVNDTFIRFGKREAPVESEDSQSSPSGESRER